MRLGKRENAQFVCVLKGEREKDTRKQWEKIGLFRTSEGAKKEKKIGGEINRKVHGEPSRSPGRLLRGTVFCHDGHATYFSSIYTPALLSHLVCRRCSRGNFSGTPSHENIGWLASSQNMLGTRTPNSMRSIRHAM